MEKTGKNVVLLAGAKSIRAIVKLHEYDDGPVDVYLEIFLNSSKQEVWLGSFYTNEDEVIPEFFTNDQANLNIGLTWGEASLKEMIHHAIIDQTGDFEHPYLKVF